MIPVRCHFPDLNSFLAFVLLILIINFSLFPKGLFFCPKLSERFLILIGQNIQKEGIATAFNNNLFDVNRKS